MKQTSALFRAFADPTRLRVLKLLARREWCVGDLVALIGHPQPTISRHLAYLRRVGLVRIRAKGVWKFYSLAPSNSPVHAYLLSVLRDSFDHLPDVQADARNAEVFATEAGCCPLVTS